MEAATQAFNDPTLTQTGMAVVGAVQGALVLFFLVSPLAGMLFHAGVKGRTTATVILAVTLLLLDVLAVGFYVLLRHGLNLPYSPLVLGILSLVAAGVLALPVGYALYGLFQRTPSELEFEQQQLQQPERTAAPQNKFDEGRQKRLARKAAYTRRKGR